MSNPPQGAEEIGREGVLLAVELFNDVQGFPEKRLGLVPFGELALHFSDIVGHGAPGFGVVFFVDHAEGILEGGKGFGVSGCGVSGFAFFKKGGDFFALFLGELAVVVGGANGLDDFIQLFLGFFFGVAQIEEHLAVIFGVG